MASPFSGFSNSIGNQPDVYGQTVSSQAPIAEGILALGKGIGSYMEKQSAKEEAEKERKLKGQIEERKAGQDLDKFALEREKSEFDKTRWYLEEGRKNRELKIKGVEGKYERLKSRLQDINASILSYQSGIQPGQQIPPEVAQRIAELRATQVQVENEMGQAGQEIETEYDTNFSVENYLRGQDSAKASSELFRNVNEEAASGWGGDVQQNTDGSISPMYTMEQYKSFQNENGSRQATPTGAAEQAAPGSAPGTGVSAGSAPKFPVNTDSNAWANSPYGRGAEGATNGQLVQQNAGYGLTGQPIELFPIGSNPILTDISSNWKNSYAYEDSTPDPRSEGGRIIYTAGADGNGIFKLAVSPAATESQKPSLERLGSMVAFANTMDNNEAANLSGLIQGDKASAATALFKTLKDKGMIPKEMDLIRFRAAAAASLFKDGGSPALGQITDSQARSVGAIVERNPGMEIKAPPALVSQATESKTTVEYRPRSASPDTWSSGGEIIDTDRVRRAMAQGFAPSSPQLKAVFDQLKFLDQQGMAKQNLIARQIQAAAAIQSAQTNAIGKQAEIAQITGKYEALLPGIGMSRGGPDVMFYKRSLGEPSGIDLSERWRTAKSEGNNLDAWNQIVGNYGFNEKLETERYQNAVEATTSFEKGFGGAMVITRLFESQVGKNWAAITYDRVAGDQAAVAAQYRLFLLGAFRKATVGLGNPSNFEQELLLNLIPDPTSAFQITSKSLAKSRMLTLLSLSNHMTDMDSSKFKMTDKSAEYYTTKLREAGILGPKDTMSVESLGEFRRILNSSAGRPDAAIAELRQWASQTGNSSVVNMVTEATSEMNIRGGTREAYAASGRINEFFRRTDFLDPSYRGSYPSTQR